MTYLICDGENKMVSLEVKVFGVQVTMLAMFLDEAQALDMLYAMERLNVLPYPHKVQPIGDSFTASVAGRR